MESPLGILVVGRDITHEIEEHGKILKGKSYLLTKKSSLQSTTLLTTLVSQGYNGLLITRDDEISLSGKFQIKNLNIRNCQHLTQHA